MDKLFKNTINYILSIGCFATIYGVHSFLFQGVESTFVIAAFGASAVLVFSNRSINHSFLELSVCSIIAALSGVFINQFDLSIGLKVALAISSCILLMNLLEYSYPPAGAIAIIPLLANAEIQNLGYLYILYPTLSGLSIIYTFSKIRLKLNSIYYDQ